MMKSTKKLTSILIAVLILVTCVSVSFTANAATGTLSSKYATNPNGQKGVQKSITIDGNFNDWSEDMLIAQGAAWDVANHWKGGHENCVLDTYSLYAAWDNSNLYVAWQMVNTTDTWANPGDGPLSDGGRVLNVPLILALSIDPTSPSMTNDITSGANIWDFKADISFNTHVDRLLYMSGKVGEGTPAMFKAVDAQGNTDYNEGCIDFKKNGIEYKMAEGNIASSIIGLNYSQSPEDVFSDDSDWVDYKTFKGEKGVHDTTYDSFYEIKIPLETLGINADYIQKNGIGAMVLATRNESALDCIPFDPSMIDNATGSYGNDPSTSHEKDDDDVITVPFARIGNTGGQPIPTTPQPTTTQPATQKPTTAEDTITVNANSNLFTTASSKADNTAKTVDVTFDLKSSMKLVNGQWKLTYDNSKLKFDPAKNSSVMPYITNGLTNYKDGFIKGNFTNVNNLYDFTSQKSLVNVTFDVIGTGSADVTLDVEELTVGYLSSGVLNYKNAVVNSIPVDLSKVQGFTNSSISGTAKVVFDQEQEDKYGDVNGDNIINIRDATLVSKYCASMTAFTDQMKARADVNHDGIISVLDATEIQKYISEVITSFD